MKRDHLLKLARLASGAAVVSMGPIAACTPSSVTTAPTGDDNRPHINSPALQPTDNPTGAGDLAEAGVTLHPNVNSPPLAVPDLNANAAAADGGAPATAPTASGPTIPRPHTNALPPGASQP